MNTPIVVSTVPTDTGAGAATTNGSPSTAGEFADALAGFLDGGPGGGATADGETATDATTETDLPGDASAVPGAEVLAATPLWAANAEMLAAALAPVTTAAGPSPQTPAVGSLSAAAVAPLAGTAQSAEATGLPAETAQPPASPVPVLTTDAGAPALAATPAGVASLAAATAAATTPPVGSVPVVGAAGATTAPGATGSLSAEGLDAQAAVTALGLTLTEQTAADTNTGAGAGSGAGAGTQVADPAGFAAGADPAPVAAVGAAPVQSSPALAASAPAAATAPRPVHVAHQVATQVATLTGAPNGVHTMTIQITPDDLGPVQVQVTLTDGVVDMTVLTALEVGRDTITQAAPDLRRYLEAAGLTCNSVEVDLNNDQSSWLTQPDAEQNFEERKSSNGREQAGTPSGDIDDSPTAGAATRSSSSTSTGVDLHI